MKTAWATRRSCACRLLLPRVVLWETDEAEQVAAAQLTTGGSTIVTRSMARRASGAQPGTQDEGSPMISTTDAEVEAVGDSLSYMHLFESSSASDSDARPYRFTVSGTQTVQ